MSQPALVVDRLWSAAPYKDEHMNTIPTHAPADTHGRLSIPGMSTLVTAKRARSIRAARSAASKKKNGITDPFTYYHLVDAILEVAPGNIFTAKEFTGILDERPIAFDPITVGRVLNDIAESLRDAYGRDVLHIARQTDGRRYWTDAQIENRVALERLLDDLGRLCRSFVPSTTSPLCRCPSVRSLPA